MSATAHAMAWRTGRTPVSGRIRDVLQLLLLIPVTRWFCHPLKATGRERLPDGPMIIVANHASHADTAAIIAALPRRVRRRLAPAAAEDYFFSSRAKGASVRVLTGAFPFPRRGDEGLVRARGLLAREWSVLLFPEGTRSRDGSIASFKCGAAKLAVLGYPVLPVGIAGTGDVLAAGKSFPRRAPVAIVIGKPVRFNESSTAEVTKDIERRVRAAANLARERRPRPVRSWHDRAAALAGSASGLAVAFAWGLAEAIAFPIVPDFCVALFALAAPRRAPKIALAAIAGSVFGGAASYVLGAVFGPGFLSHAPLVAPKMTAAAGTWLSSEGAGGLSHQAFSGVPYKVFAWQAAGHGVPLLPFLLQTVAARAPRILLVAGAFAGSAVLLRRWMRALYPALAAVFVTIFAMGLARVVAHWS